MSLHGDLMMQARMLATVDAGIPLQANLRRALSTACYALFHLLIAEVAGLRARVARSFSHGEMNRVCLLFAKLQLPDELRVLLPVGASSDLWNVAASFCLLQEARHDADYDLAYTLSRPIALSQVEASQEAIQLVTALGPTDERAVFFTALAFGTRWSK